MIRNESTANAALSLQADRHAAECARWAAVLTPTGRAGRIVPPSELQDASPVFTLSVLGVSVLSAFLIIATRF